MDTNNGRVPANDIICAVLIPLSVVRVAIKRTIKRALGPQIDAVQRVINAKVNKPVIWVKYNDGVLTVHTGVALEQCANCSCQQPAYTIVS